jgi:GTP pyrophosphokinase
MANTPQNKEIAALTNAITWLEELITTRKFNAADKQLLQQALTFAQITGADRLNPYGEPCLAQGIAMVNILNGINADPTTLAAALLYSNLRHTDLTIDNITEHLGDKIAKLIQGAKRMDSIGEFYKALAGRENYRQNLDNIRKMLITMVDDIRIVLIKLAEQLYILRCAAQFPLAQKQQIAKETMALYGPLANRLGMVPIKWELEDLAFRYLEPQTYNKIFTSLKQSRIERERYIKNLINEITKLLGNVNLTHFKISGRAKHIYSIYRKMSRKNVTIKDIYDASAIRVLVQNIDDCYTALSSIHAKWQLIPQEFDDYITNPKPNGYRSIHTAVIGPKKRNVEIQIRTYDMHEQAELGMAAHWIYKEGGEQQKAGYETKISWLRQLMDWQQGLTSDAETIATINKVFSDRIYVFTPSGDILDLPTDATPLDFAYHVHSEIGNHCTGAKVNGTMVPLNHKLKTGERVEIITSKKAHPSRDWLSPELNFLKSALAKAKVLNWFKKQHHDKHIELGLTLFAKEIKRQRVPEKNIDYTKAAVKLNLKTKDDMLAALGRGDIKVSAILNALQIRPATQLEEPKITPFAKTTAASKAKPTKRSSPGKKIKIQGVDNLLTNIANCCKPVPGDKITGYITRGKGVSIHRADCHNILYAYNNRPERLLFVCWSDTSNY